METVLHELPRYRSHKEVWALKIKSIVILTASELAGWCDAAPDGAMIYAEETFAPVHVDQAYMAKHTPAVGGYYVRYDDGYESWSPAAAFEAGYTKVEN